jgi:hypothetical protein
MSRRRQRNQRAAGDQNPPALRAALGDYDRPEEWLLIEWPKGEDEPIKYLLSTLPNGASTLLSTTSYHFRRSR